MDNAELHHGDNWGTNDDLLDMVAGSVGVYIIAMLPNSSRYARAVLDIDIVDIMIIHGCMLLGDAWQTPNMYRLAMPGKRTGKTNKSEWVHSITMQKNNLFLYLEKLSQAAFEAEIAKKIDGIDPRYSRPLFPDVDIYE